MRSGSRDKAYGQAPKGHIGSSTPLFMHFPTDWGYHARINWVKQATPAATLLALLALQAYYTTAPGNLTPETQPRTLELSALTAAISCP